MRTPCSSLTQSILGLIKAPSRLLRGAGLRPILACPPAPFSQGIAVACPLNFGWRSSMVEHLFCKQVVVGSIPVASSDRCSLKLPMRLENYNIPEGCPSGQREQTVNLPAMPTLVRIHTLHSRAFTRIASHRVQPHGVHGMSRGISSVGRASAFQAERRRFESVSRSVPCSPTSCSHASTTAHIAQW